MLSRLLPSACALCGLASDGAVCAPCTMHYVSNTVRCPCCANPVDAAGQCGPCLRAPPAFDATVAAADYAPPLDQLVLRLKFGGQLAIARWCALRLCEAAQASAGFVQPELLCAVPLGRARLVERGFNQALEIARPLARAWRLPLHRNLVVRARETAAQSGVAPADRRRNIARAFAVPAASIALLQGRHIGVVDDVMTSGATLDELAGTLKRHGAARVSNLVFARTPPR